MMWLAIISLFVLLIAAILGLGGGIISFLDKHANILDTQYIPMDAERSTLEKPKNTFDQQQFKPKDKPKP